MDKVSIYQSKEWINAKVASGEKAIPISRSLAFERVRKFPFIGSKKILFAEGSVIDLELFKEKSKNYFYGLLAPTVVNYDAKAFADAGMKKVINHTVLIGLDISKDDLWKSLEKKSIRWGVKIAEKNGLKIRAVKNHKEVKEFYALYKNIAQEGGFPPEKESFVRLLADTAISKLFLVKKNEKIIAGGLLLIDKNNNYSILNLTASSEEGLKLQAMPYLYWNLIIYSKDSGLKHFDLGGYDRDARENEKTYNINKFKERFGGEIVEQPLYSTNWKYPFFRDIFKRFGLLRSLYKRSK